MAEQLGPIQHKRGTTQQWASSTVPLRDGELGIDTTLRRMKVGDGSTLWAGLPFSSMAAAEIARLEAAATALEGATAPTDAAMTTIQANPSSAFAQAQKATFVAVRTSDGKALPPGTIVVITLDKTLAQVTANPVADIADITFQTGA